MTIILNEDRYTLEAELMLQPQGLNIRSQLNYNIGLSDTSALKAI
jgi:hypothetical protein